MKITPTTPPEATMARTSSSSRLYFSGFIDCTPT
jgi:hypothetical protein